MIVVENVKINGEDFRKTYSDEGFMIEREGVKYSEAIDPIEFSDRVYIETEEKIESDEEQEPEEIEEIQVEDKK